MLQKRLNSVAVCHIHNDILDRLNVDAILRVILQLVRRYSFAFSGFDFTELTHLQTPVAEHPAVYNRCSGILMSIFVAIIKQQVVVLSCYHQLLCSFFYLMI